MFQTLIVDDDFLVRSYLKQLAAWEKAGYEIVADVRDGEEALGIIRQQPPDVVVTDISMPLMDGIELIRQIRMISQDIYIIVLSCHDDFDYVKEAMKLGANEYVLKNSLDEDSLYDVLKNAEHQMDSIYKKNSEEARTQKLIQMGSHTLKFHYFNQVLAGTLSHDEREEKRAEAGICGQFTNSAVISMFIRNWSGIKNEHTPLDLEQYNQLFLHRLEGQLEDLLGGESCYVETIYLGEGIFCCFLDLSKMHRSSLMKQRLTSVASACYRFCKEEPYDYAVGVSNICIGEEGIRQAYQQAREMVKLSFYDSSRILYFDSQKSISRQMPASAEEFLSHAGEYAAGRREEEFQKGLETVLADCTKAYTDPKLIVHWLKELDRETGVRHAQEEYSTLCGVEDLERLYVEYRKQLFSIPQRDIPPGVSNVVRQSVAYIQQHFKESIGLGEVADAVGLNSAYLSYLFKQEMGVGFSNYLLECRMDHARDLLKNTGNKIKDVAAQSGFNDYHYFSKAFKKMNGCSPADYRKQE